MTMKKALKIILPVLVIAMLVCALAVFASAAETTYMTITDNDGNVTNHTNVDFTAEAAKVHENVKIKLLQDMTWGSSSTSTTYNCNLKGKCEVDLNGKTLTMNSKHTGRFEFGTDADIVFKNGKIVIKNANSKFYGGYSGNKLTFDGVTVYSNGTIADWRYGELNFVNCHVGSTANTRIIHAGGQGGLTKATVNFKDSFVKAFAGSTAPLFTAGRGNDGTTKPGFGVYNFDNTVVETNYGFVASNSNAYSKDKDSDDKYIRDETGKLVERTNTADWEGAHITLNFYNGSELLMSSAKLARADIGNYIENICFNFAEGTKATYVGDSDNANYLPQVNLGSYAGGVFTADNDNYVKAAYGVLDSECAFVSLKKADAVNLTLKNGDQVIETRYMATGYAPETTKRNDFVSDVKYDAAQKTFVGNAITGWVDANGEAVDTLTEGGELTLTAVIGQTRPYWVSLSADDPATATIKAYEFYDNNLEGKISSANKVLYVCRDMIYHTAKGVTIGYEQIIDLGGNTLTVSECADGDYCVAYKGDACIRVSGDGSKLVIRRGTFASTNTKLFYLQNTTGKLDVIDMTLAPQYLAAGDFRGSDVNFTNVVLVTNGNNSGVGFNINQQNGAQKATYTFKNVTVRKGTGVVKNFISYSRTATDNIATIVFDGFTVEKGAIRNTTDANSAILSSSVKGTANNYLDLKIKGAFMVPEKQAIVYLNNATSNMKVSVENLSYNDKGAWDLSTFKNATRPTGVHAYNGTAVPYTLATDPATYETATINYPDSTTESQYIMQGVKPLFKTYCMNGADATVVDGAWLENECKTAVGGATAAYAPVYKLPAYAIYKADGSAVAHSVSNQVKANFMSPASTSGSVIRLYEDIYVRDIAYTGSGDITALSVPIGSGTGAVTLDLNGKTLDLTCKDLVVEGKDGPQNAILRITVTYNKTVKNGTILNDNKEVFYCDFNNTTLTLDNVKAESATSVFDIRKTTTINISGGSQIISTAGSTTESRVFSLAYNLADITINVDDSTLTAPILAGHKPNYQAVSKMNITINNSVVNATRALVFLSNDYGYLDPDTVFNLTVNNSSINAVLNYELNRDKTQGKGPNKTSRCKETITFNECFFKVNPEDYSSTKCEYEPNVVYGEGQTLLTTDKAGYPYKVGAVTLPVSSNLTLYSDFNLNLFLGNNATKVMVGDTELTLEEYDAKTVKASLKSIAPNTAADSIVFAISYVDDGVTYTANFNYSVVKYATTLLAGGYSAESKALVASAVKYIDTAYAVADAEKPATLTALTASEGYTTALATASNLAKGDIDGAGNYTALAVAINSAQLRLSDDYKYVLNLKETYTGTLKVNNVTYNVVNGTVNGKTYVTVTLRGYEFNDGLTVTATTAEGTVEGTYTLADYVEAMANGTDADLDALLVALYNFTVEAKEYNDYAKTNGLK